MKLYIVTESNNENNLVLRTWVCFTEEQAKDCLKKYYDIACTYNFLSGVDAPADCLENGFFFWKMQNGMELRYNISDAKTFAD